MKYLVVNISRGKSFRLDPVILVLIVAGIALTAIPRATGTAIVLPTVTATMEVDHSNL